tara:strand:- start:476 stop:781 length:306 start_codon:yes stop_codon:yes gene_type:complete
MLSEFIKNKELVNQLWHTGMTTPIWSEQPDRFEIVIDVISTLNIGEVSHIPETGIIVWVDNFLEAYIVSQYYEQNDYDAIILYDTSAEYNGYCVWSNAEKL